LTHDGGHLLGPGPVIVVEGLGVVNIGKVVGVVVGVVEVVDLVVVVKIG